MAAGWSVSVPINSNATSGAAYGGTSSTGSFNVGRGSSGGVSLGALLQQYWPVLAAVAVVVYLRRRK